MNSPHYCPGAECVYPTCPNFRKFGDASARAKTQTSSASPEMLPLYYLDQNQNVPTPYCVTVAQGNAMKEAGRGRFINRGRAMQSGDRMPARQRFVCSQSGSSDRCISYAEMEANVGIAGDLRDWREESPAPRHVVDRAQKKIRAIGRHDEGTFDDKAPLAFGSWGPVYPAAELA